MAGRLDRGPGKARADEILLAIQEKRHSKDRFWTEVKNGPTQYLAEGLLILDGVAMKPSWANPLITGYEVKVSRSDWLKDTKWTGYLSLCHEFYLACPKDLIPAGEVPEGVGLLYHYPDSGALRIVRKAVWRDIELPLHMLYYLCIARLDSDRYPFFSSDREYFEALVQDKQIRRELGYRGSKKVRELLRKTERRQHELEAREGQLDWKLREWEDVKLMLKTAGIDPGRYRWKDRLHRLLVQGKPLGLEEVHEGIVDLNQRVQRLRERVEEMKAKEAVREDQLHA